MNGEWAFHSNFRIYPRTWLSEETKCYWRDEKRHRFVISTVVTGRIVVIYGGPAVVDCEEQIKKLNKL